MVYSRKETDHEAAESTELLLSSDESDAISASIVFDRRREDDSAIWYCCWVCMNIILKNSLV